MSKRLLLLIHRYCGLAAALFLLVQAATGAMLVYRAELARLADPAGMVRQSQGPDAPLSAILCAIRDQHPDWRIRRIFFPIGADGVYFVHLTTAEGAARYASLDPGSTRILRAGGIWSFPAEAALRIHYEMMSGLPGRIFILLVGISLLGMIATGLAYWWPRRGRWRKSLAIDLRLAPKLVLRHFHRSLGALLAPLILLSAATGAYLAFVLLIESPAPPARLSSPPSVTAPDRALALARSQFPGSAVRDIRIPDPGTFNILLRAPERNAEAVHLVRVDLATNRVLARIPADRDPSLWVPILPIHNGKALGTIGRIILLLGALAIATLTVTGPLMWLQARKPSKKKPVLRSAP